MASVEYGEFLATGYVSCILEYELSYYGNPTLMTLLLLASL